MGQGTFPEKGGYIYIYIYIYILDHIKCPLSKSEIGMYKFHIGHIAINPLDLE